MKRTLLLIRTFGHGNILKHSRRLPFLSPNEVAILNAGGPAVRDLRVSQESIDRHDTALIDNINAVVGQNDTFWILGDFSMGGSYEVARRYRDRIVCRNVNLVWGNHDKRVIRPLFGIVLEQGMVRVGDQDIWLNHYPMRSWDKSFHGSWHLYGHVHGRMKHLDDADPYALTKDAGVDANDYKPFSMAELRTYMAPRMAKFYERKAGLSRGKSDVDWA